MDNRGVSQSLESCEGAVQEQQHAYLIVELTNGNQFTILSSVETLQDFRDDPEALAVRLGVERRLALPAGVRIRRLSPVVLGGN